MKILKVIGLSLAVILVLVIGYVAYVFIDYHRIDDAIAPEIYNIDSNPVMLDTVYTITTFNVGFGAYSSDYSFFMDGGTSSRAFSREEAINNINKAVDIISQLEPNFALFQEVDTRSTRSYHVNELELLKDYFPGYASVFALNYDSPYLMYPILQPIGKSVSGIVTLSDYSIASALRRSLPIESGFRKLLDIDRCYTITRIPASNGYELVLINLHLSAYTADVSIGEQQLKMLFEDAKKEYDAGNYVIIGGDFNKDILGDSPERFQTKIDIPNWAKPLNTALVPEGFTVLRPESNADIWPTVRDCDTGYVEGVTFVSAIDGFIVSDNVKPVHEAHINAEFMYTDHNPVLLQFTLEQNVSIGGD